MIELNVIQSPEGSKSLEFKNDEIYIGRSPDCDIQIKDIMVSRKHLKISIKENKYKIMDLQSSNGTIVENNQISSGTEIEIGEGTPIRIGATVISVGALDEKELQKELNSTLHLQGSNSSFKTFREKRRMTLKNNIDLLYKISNLFGELSDLNMALDKALSYILCLLNRVDRVFLILFDHEKKKISSDVIFKLRNDSPEIDMSYNQDIVDLVLRDNNAVMIPNVYSEDDISFVETLKLKTGSIMCLPLISCSRFQGLIYIDTTEKAHGFRKDDLCLLKALSTPLALAIENSTHYERI